MPQDRIRTPRLSNSRRSAINSEPFVVSRTAAVDENQPFRQRVQLFQRLDKGPHQNASQLLVAHAQHARRDVTDDAQGASRGRQGDGRRWGGRRTLVAGQDDVEFGSLPLDGGSPTQGGGCVPRVIGFGVVVDHDSQRFEPGFGECCADAFGAIGTHQTAEIELSFLHTACPLGIVVQSGDMSPLTLSDPCTSQGQAIAEQDKCGDKSALQIGTPNRRLPSIRETAQVVH